MATETIDKIAQITDLFGLTLRGIEEHIDCENINPQYILNGLLIIHEQLEETLKESGLCVGRYAN